MNIDQPVGAASMPASRHAVQIEAIDSPAQNLSADSRTGASDARRVTQVTLPAAKLKPTPHLTTSKTQAASTPIPVGAADSLPAPLPPWAAPTGTSFRQVLDAWTMRAGWKLVWEATSAGPPVPAMNVKGDFLAAVRELLSKSQKASDNHPIKVEAFPRQKIIHVIDKD